MQNKETLADGENWYNYENSEGFRFFVNLELGLVEDWQSLPRVRAEIERVTKQVTERIRQEAHVADLMAVLKHRSVRLLTEQIERLRSTPYAELPSMQVALDAEDADDFMRRAGH